VFVRCLCATLNALRCLRCLRILGVFESLNFDTAAGLKSLLWGPSFASPESCPSTSDHRRLDSFSLPWEPSRQSRSRWPVRQSPARPLGFRILRNTGRKTFNATDTEHPWALKRVKQLDAVLSWKHRGQRAQVMFEADCIWSSPRPADSDSHSQNLHI
jgi:hypothetical protein